MKAYFKILVLITTALLPLMANAQYYTVYKTDGTNVTYRHIDIDSIVFSMEVPVTHEYVDLGLSVKWGTCNIGATAPEEYGAYLSWGEISEKEEQDYKWRNYSIDGKALEIGDISNTSYDAAHVKWGGSWRMPTKEECQELVEKCTWERTTQKGIEGCLVTGANGKSIFLPATGYIDSGGKKSVGEMICYWTSTPEEDTIAYTFGFTHISYVGDMVTYIGVPIRPVRE